MERIVRRYRQEGSWPDLWTGHYGDGGLCGALLQERTGVPFTFTAHSLGAWKLDRLLQPRDAPVDELRPVAEAVSALDARFRFGARIAAERSAIARAAAIVTSTAEERFEQYAHPAYRGAIDVRDERRFAVIPPGVNLAIFHPEAWGSHDERTRAAISRALHRDIAPERHTLPAVIAWSRLDPKKNHLSLVHAFARSPELRERTNLILITRGLDDPLRHPETACPVEQLVLRPLIAEVERANLWGAVSAFHLAGQEELAALYRWGVETCSVFCLPSVYEPFGLSVIEAMAVGLPVVASSNGGPREITEEGRFGLLADPCDHDQLAAQLLRLVIDADEWRRYAARGRQHALDWYSWRRTAQGYAVLAGEIARGKHGGRSSFPLPDFARSSGEVELPRLDGWEVASRSKG
ncbi:MAG: glycosyltransferase [Chloroflexi bacterium]|nr:glycosyltransferase [Chloroflexota bacterium]